MSAKGRIAGLRCNPANGRSRRNLVDPERRGSGERPASDLVDELAEIGVPFGGGDRFVGKQPVKPRRHPPGRPEMALVDARRRDVMMLSIDSAWP
jgi:hypothetical protein